MTNNKLNMKKNSSFFILGVILLNFISVTDIYACYAVIAGKKATKDGSVLIAHAEQNGPPAYLNFMVVPRFKFEPGSFVKFAKGGLYPQPAESYSYLWSEIYGLGGSDGIMNEWGVICVSDATRTIDHTVKEMTRLGEIKEGGVTLEIRLEIARRAKTARQAIHIAADLLNKFGYGGGG